MNTTTSGVYITISVTDRPNQAAQAMPKRWIREAQLCEAGVSVVGGDRWYIGGSPLDSTGPFCRMFGTARIRM